MALTLVWKELREQWIFWLAFALMAACGVSALHRLLETFGRVELVRLVLCVAGWGYGTLSAALALAGDSEEGTQAFLDLMPATRQRLWLLKASVALALLSAQTLVLQGIGAQVLRDAPASEQGVAASSIFFWGLVGLAWGLFCGSFASTVLAAVGWAAGLQTAIAATLYLLILGRRLIQPLLEGEVFRQLPPLAAVSAAAALVGSWRIYCRHDLFRLAGLRPAKVEDETRTTSELFLVTCGEVAPFALGMAAIAAAATLARVVVGAEAVQPIGIASAVLCGIATFASDLPPRHESGNWRAPLDEYWILREVSRWAATILFAGLAASAVAVVALTESFSRPDVRVTRPLRTDVTNFNGFVEFLIYAMVFGYVIGLIYGICYRKWKSHGSPDSTHG
jgi:hypothetical protein